MDAIAGWFDGWRAAATGILGGAVDYLPSLLAALALLVAGWLAARLTRIAVVRVAGAINGFLRRLRRGTSGSRLHLPSAAIRVAATVGFWVVMLFFVAASAHVARLDALAEWMDGIIAHVPSMLAGGLIILAGYVISTLVRDLVLAGLSPSGVDRSGMAAFVAQGATFLIAVVIGIDQIGVDVSFLVTIVSIVLGGTFVSLAVAFGLGARTLISNLLGAHDVKRYYEPGQSVRVGRIEGEILELTTTSIIVETDEGRVVVPAKVFHERATTLRVPSS